MRSEIHQVVLFLTRGTELERASRVLQREKNGESEKDAEEGEESFGKNGDRARVARSGEGQAAADLSDRSFKVHEHRFAGARDGRYGVHGAASGRWRGRAGGDGAGQGLFRVMTLAGALTVGKMGLV